MVFMYPYQLRVVPVLVAVADDQQVADAEGVVRMGVTAGGIDVCRVVDVRGVALRPAR